MHTSLRLLCTWRGFRHRLARRSRDARTDFAAGVLNAGAKSRALLVHLVEPFSDPGVDVRHQNRWQARELGRLLAARGHALDVAAPGSNHVPADASYDVIIDLHPGLTRYPVGANTQRVAYITGSDPSFSNAAERHRLADVARRRGVTLQARRQVPEFSANDLGRCTAMWFIGSPHNLETYRAFPVPPVSFVRNFAYPVPAAPRDGADPRQFLFLASGGQVHKGLDLLLEVFARRPEWTLHVCSSFHEEPDFVGAYRDELLGRPNIVPHGFQRLDSPRFTGIAARCGFMLLPSCSEANAGSVLSGMAAGLVPIVSRECGFAADEVSYFPACTPEAIEAALAEHAARSPAALAAEGRRMRELVAARYTPQHFTASLEAAFQALPHVPASSR